MTGRYLVRATSGIINAVSSIERLLSDSGFELKSNSNYKYDYDYDYRRPKTNVLQQGQDKVHSVVKNCSVHKTDYACVIIIFRKLK